MTQMKDQNEKTSTAVADKPGKGRKGGTPPTEGQSDLQAMAARAREAAAKAGVTPVDANKKTAAPAATVAAKTVPASTSTGTGNKPPTPTAAVPATSPAATVKEKGKPGQEVRDSEGRLRVWAELWLTDEQILQLEAIADSTEGVKGRRQMATKIAQELVPVKIGELSTSMAEKIEEMKKARQPKQVDPVKKAKQDAKKTDMALKLLAERGFISQEALKELQAAAGQKTTAPALAPAAPNADPSATALPNAA